MNDLALVFDIYGTLIDPSAMHKFVQPIAGERTGEVLKTWRQKQLEYSFRRGMMNVYIDFSVCTQQALVYSLQQNNVSYSQNDLTSLSTAYKTLPAFEDVQTTLGNLKNRKFQLYAFSNGSKSAVETLLKEQGLLFYFECVISVEDVQSFKPDPKVYEHLVGTIQKEPAQTLLISANSFDVIGAKNAGLKAVWVNRKSENKFDPWKISADYTIESLSELSEVLQS